MPGRILRRAGDVPTRSLWTKIKDVALTDVTVLARGGAIQGSLENLEQILLEADFGVPTTMRLVAEIEGQARRGFIKTQEQFLRALESGIENSLRSGNSDPAFIRADVGADGGARGRGERRRQDDLHREVLGPSEGE